MPNKQVVFFAVDILKSTCAILCRQHLVVQSHAVVWTWVSEVYLKTIRDAKKKQCIWKWAPRIHKMTCPTELSSEWNHGSSHKASLSYPGVEICRAVSYSLFRWLGLKVWVWIKINCLSRHNFPWVSSFNVRITKGGCISALGLLAMQSRKMVANWTSAYFGLGLWSTSVQDTTWPKRNELFLKDMSPRWLHGHGVAFIASTAQAAAAKAGGRLPIDTWVTWVYTILDAQNVVKIFQAKAKLSVSTCRMRKLHISVWILRVSRPQVGSLTGSLCCSWRP